MPLQATVQSKAIIEMRLIVIRLRLADYGWPIKFTEKIDNWNAANAWIPKSGM
jgi:hypothetical protein